MSYTRVQLTLNVTSVLSYIATILNSRPDYSFNYGYCATITDQTMYDASGWWYDTDPKPSWTDITDNWDDVVSYYNLTPTPNESIENMQVYLEGELDTVLTGIDSDISALETTVAGLGSPDLSSLVPKTTTVNGHALSSNVTVTKSDLSLGNVDNTSDANKPVSTAQQTALNAKFNTPSGTTAQYVRGDGTLATLPGGSRTFNNPTRSLNSAFQISTTQDSLVSYSVDIASTISLTSGQTGTVYLRYADDSGHTTNVKEVARFVNGNSGTLTIGLNLTQSNTGTLTGMIPAGKYGKIVTENTSGTPTFTYRSAQEVLL